jgi:hypothetical protein
VSPWTEESEFVIPGARWKQCPPLIVGSLLIVGGYVVLFSGIDMVGRPIESGRWVFLAMCLVLLSGFLLIGWRDFVRNSPLVLNRHGFHMKGWKEPVLWTRVGEFSVRRLWWPPFWSTINFPLSHSRGRKVAGTLPDFFKLPARDVVRHLEDWRVRHSASDQI